jgi:hypothetical protein
MEDMAREDSKYLITVKNLARAGGADRGSGQVLAAGLDRSGEHRLDHSRDPVLPLDHAGPRGIRSL